MRAWETPEPDLGVRGPDFFVEWQLVDQPETTGTATVRCGNDEVGVDVRVDAVRRHPSVGGRVAETRAWR